MIPTESLNSPLVEIDAEEVLREYGLENMAQTSTVVQQNDNIITIPSMLEPPRVDSAPQDMEEILTNVDVNAENVNVRVDAPPINNIDGVIADLDAEEDNDWNILENSGVISESVLSGEETSEEEQLLTEESPNIEESNEEQTAVEDIPTDLNTLSEEDLLKLLPVNSKGFELDESTSRFSGAEWFKAIQETTVTLAGVGGIGSWVYSILSRMKPAQVFIYDDDIVETANLSGQMYFNSMVGKRKVDAMAELAKDFSIYHGTMAIPFKFTPDTAATDIMICGFDNMEARRVFFKAWIKHLVDHPHPERCLYIDGRL